MEGYIIGLVIICIIITPPIFLSIDFLIKGAYILYWEHVFKSRFDLLFEFLNAHPQTIKKRRETIDGRIVIRLDSRNVSYRPYDFVIDFEKNYIEILGTSDKVLRTIDNNIYVAPRRIKIPKNLKDKLKSSFSPITVCPIDLTKFNKRTLKMNLNGKPPKSNIPFINWKSTDKQSEAKKLAYRTYMERTSGENLLYRVINLQTFIGLCIDRLNKNGTISKQEVNDLLTDKIMEYSYR